MKKLSLNKQILFAAIVGASAGLYVNSCSSGTTCPLNAWAAPKLLFLATVIGTIFIGLLKMVLMPLVFSSITTGIANLKSDKEMNATWKTTLIYFISTTMLATLIGLIAVNLFQPGKGLNLALGAVPEKLKIQNMNMSDFALSYIEGLFVNPVSAMANGQILPVILFSILIGVALIILGPKAQSIRNGLNQFFEMLMLVIHWIMKLAPYGVAALLFKLLATQDLKIVSQMGVFVGVVLGAIFIHGAITLPLILKILTPISPLRFFKSMERSLLTAFSTSSSAATLPVTMECVEENLKVDKDIAGFVLPLGATMNMDGTALYEAIAALFIANMVGIELNVLQQIIVFFMAITAAIGAPGIPSAGMVTMVMVLQSVGLPAEAIAILLPIDRLLDAFRTTINVEGDAIGSCVVQQIVSQKTKNAKS